MSKEKILIVGATGTVGRELSRLLQGQGHELKLATSDKAKVDAGTGHVFLNLLTGEGIKDAFEGVEKAFLLSPPGYSDQYKLLSPLIQEAKRKSLRKVVLMTAMGANANEAAPFRRVEIELEKSGLAYNIIRPNWFLQNFHTFWIQGIRSQGKILLPAGKAKVSFIDARDIAAVAAELLTSTRFDNKDFDLTGEQAVNHDEVAKALSQVTGRQISYQEISPEEFKSGLLGAGLPADYADFLTLIMGFLKEGYSERSTTAVREITGRSPLSLMNYAQDYKNQWL